MNTNQSRCSKSNHRTLHIAALALAMSLCLFTADVLARDLGRGIGGKGPGVRPGVGVGGVGAGLARTLPAGYHRTVAAGYTTVVRAGVTCRFVGGVYYRAATYQGETVWVVVP